MKCPKCGSQELTTLESRRNKLVRPKSPPTEDGQALDLAVKDAIDTYGDNWPHGLQVEISQKFGVSRSHVSYRKRVALETPEKTSDVVINTATRLIKEINVPFIRRRRECLICQYRFTTYELREADLSELRPVQASDDYALDGYTIMRAYTKAIRTLEQSMEKSLKSAKQPKQ